MNDELVIYLLVRDDIKMSKGKTAAQCCHAVQDLIIQCPKHILKQYTKNHNTKICLKIHDLEEMEEIINDCTKEGFLYCQVIDAGLTELQPNTATVLGIGPISKNKINPIVNQLKLL